MAHFVAIPHGKKTHYIDLDAITHCELSPSIEDTAHGAPKQTGLKLHLQGGIEVQLVDKAAEAALQEFKRHHSIS
jgi:hypothetical protein